MHNISLQYVIIYMWYEKYVLFKEKRIDTESLKSLVPPKHSDEQFEQYYSVEENRVLWCVGGVIVYDPNLPTIDQPQHQ